MSGLGFGTFLEVVGLSSPNLGLLEFSVMERLPGLIYELMKNKLQIKY